MSNKEKKEDENTVRLSKAINNLTQIAQSTSIPRNIRKLIWDSINVLQDQKQSAAIRAANAISLLDEISQDPNMPSHARTTLWAAVSELEAIKE